MKKRLESTKPVHIYRMTISSSWYDEEEQKAKEYELHFQIARYGDIRTVRTHLAKRGLPYFQQMVYRKYKRWIKKNRIKTRFEGEEPALKSQSIISIEARRMEYRGKRWNAYPLPSRKLSYAKRRRKK